APETSLRLLTAGGQVIGGLPAVLSALALAAPGVPASPLDAPRCIVVASLASPTAGAAAALATSLSPSELGRGLFFIFAAAPLPPPAREHLRAVTMVNL